MGNPVAHPVRLVPYDPAWPARFEEERLVLEGALGAWIVGGVHHIGSTAVPGLASKPVIDAMVGVESLEAALPAREAMERLGYAWSPYRPEAFHLYVKPPTWPHTHHVLLVPHRDFWFGARLAFRDALRDDPALAREYEALKRELADRHGRDRDAYTTGKADFIARMTRAAVERQRAASSETAVTGL